MCLSPDEEVISAHPEIARWMRQKCSVCGSITPEAFIDALRNGHLVRGWQYKGGRPDFCLTDRGVFKYDHIKDRGDVWLREHQAEIAAATGLVAYWEGERLIDRTFVGKRPIEQLESLDEQTVTRISRFLSKIRERHAA